MKNINIHLGTNSFITLVPMTAFGLFAFSSGLLNIAYIKGLETELIFIIGLVSTLFGLGFYKFWHFGAPSVYSFHYIDSKLHPKNTTEIFRRKTRIFLIGQHATLPKPELPRVFRKLFCILTFFFLTLLTLDNRNFYKLQQLPLTLFSSNSDNCPPRLEDDKLIGEIPPGCSLVLRAYELGYTKDLGQCAPKELSQAELSVCTKRRIDEPYLHYSYRLLVNSLKGFKTAVDQQNVDKIRTKFDMQWQQVDALRDYRLYAINAAPRASHHIWTNLPTPREGIKDTLKNLLDLDDCVERFQHQSNTVSPSKNVEVRESRFLQHAYGQLLFNPKVERTVAFCKEYQIHWNSDMDTCNQLVNAPEETLDAFSVLEDVELVLNRYNVSKTISALDVQLESLNKTTSGRNDSGPFSNPINNVTGKERKQIDTRKIAQSKQLREVEDVLSFTCFMQVEDNEIKHITDELQLYNHKLAVNNRYVPKKQGDGESQLAIYQQFAKALNNQFHYSRYQSRSKVNVETSEKLVSATEDKAFLENSDYLLSRLEVLNDVDIFLENDWVFERKDLLEVYPFHLHQENFIDSFRVEYQQSHGRL